jgi:hypothetical protein
MNNDVFSQPMQEIVTSAKPSTLVDVVVKETPKRTPRQRKGAVKATSSIKQKKILTPTKQESTTTPSHMIVQNVNKEGQQQQHEESDTKGEQITSITPLPLEHRRILPPRRARSRRQHGRQSSLSSHASTKTKKSTSTKRKSSSLKDDDDVSYMPGPKRQKYLWSCPLCHKECKLSSIQCTKCIQWFHWCVLLLCIYFVFS